MLVQRPSSLVLGQCRQRAGGVWWKGAWQLSELPGIASKGLPAAKGMTFEPKRIIIIADEITLNL